MVKIYKWSDILNYLVCTVQSNNEQCHIKSCLKIISDYIDNNLQNDYYRYANIFFIRSGSPAHNEVNPDNTNISPYSIKSIDTDEASTIMLKHHEYLDNIGKFVLSKEYLLWGKIKKLFKEYDISFIEFKNMYESDIVYYIKNRTVIEYPENEFDTISVETVSNSEYESKSTFDYNIPKIERLLT